MHPKYLSVPVALAALAITGLAQSADKSEYSDPRFPEELEHQTAGILERGKAALERREHALEEQLKQFPTPESRVSPPHQNFGYLSDRDPISATNDTREAWVQLSFFGKWTSHVDGIGLIPAYYPEFSAEGNYGFPKRFKIEVFSHQEPDIAVTVVDWTGEDFPDPGLHPVFFSFPPRSVKTVRLTVTKGAVEGNNRFFALNELMVFQQGNNVAPPAYQGLTASGSFEEEPYWKLQYLTNRKMHLGACFHSHKTPEDFIQYFDQKTLGNKQPEIWIDLGNVYELGRVELYPAKKPGVPIPAVAYPLKYQIELRRWNKSKPIVQSSIIENELPTQMHWSALSSNKGRFIRIVFHALPTLNGHPALGLGEIRVIGDDDGQVKNFAIGSKVTTTHFPADGATDTSLLVDGFSNGREIIQERLFIQQLAQRKVIEHDLFQTRHHLMIVRATRKSYVWMFGISGGTILFFSLVFWIFYQRAVRQRALLNLRRQIAADLHDDISSNLGTISMITKRLQQDPSPSLIRQKLAEIGHIAQESFLSVKEIIWHMDSDIVHLSEMFEQLEKTAKSILDNCQVDFTYPPPQGIPVPPKIRRNLMLLVKESLYNCSKYANARHIQIHAEMKDSVLELSMIDDGVGFDPSGATIADSDSGRGLANMERRAKLLGAELDIHSVPGEGTQVTLRMPLK